jgi:PIN domain nuclease of toxin-antitoxin system
LILLDTNAVIWALAGDARADTLFASGRRPRLAL